MKKKNLGIPHSCETNINIFNIKNYGKKMGNIHRPKSIEFCNKNYSSKKLDNIVKLSKININQDIEFEKNNSYEGFLSESEIMKINEHMRNDSNFILLKKISQLKKTIHKIKIQKKMFLNIKLK